VLLTFGYDLPKRGNGAMPMQLYTGRS
jgi:hypothetical protein